MKEWIGGAAGGTLAAVVITYIWWINSQPHPTPVNALRDLAASPLCVTAGGAPLPGSPTVEAAWERFSGHPVAQAHPRYHGDRSIELQYNREGTLIPVGFVRVGDPGAHHWRPALESSTMAWANSMCHKSSP